MDLHSSSSRPSRQPAGPADDGLHSTLGRRQMNMIAIGGVIGAGLFVGSGKAIGMAGPGVLLAYLGVGALVVLVMRMLTEMAVAQPETGSFSSYASRELGTWAGLSVGWLYAYQWCVTVGFESMDGRRHRPPHRPGAAVVAVRAHLHAGADRGEPVARELVRRVRVLVLAHQGGGHPRVHRPGPGGAGRPPPRVQLPGVVQPDPQRRRSCPAAAARCCWPRWRCSSPTSAPRS